MASIFVSYRRTDAAGHAGRLYDQLANRFGAANVFKDLDSMEPGADFAEVIEDTVARCDALIAVIGSDWLSPRLEDPDDWVRLEIAHALARKVRVVPVLVEGAKMPAPTDLPEDLSALSRRHAVDLSETGWHAQVTEFLDRFEKVLDADSDALAAGPVAQVRPADARPPSGDRQEEGPAGTWTVDAQWSTDRVLTLKMQSGAATHVLTAQNWVRLGRGGKSLGPLVMLDGEELDYTTSVLPDFPQLVSDRYLSGVITFPPETTLGRFVGRLNFSVDLHVSMVEPTFVVLTIDGERAYEHGDVPDYIRPD